MPTDYGAFCPCPGRSCVSDDPALHRPCCPSPSSRQTLLNSTTRSSSSIRVLGAARTAVASSFLNFVTHTRGTASQRPEQPLGRATLRRRPSHRRRHRSPPVSCLGVSHSRSLPSILAPPAPEHRRRLPKSNQRLASSAQFARPAPVLPQSCTGDARTLPLPQTLESSPHSSLLATPSHRRPLTIHPHSASCAPTPVILSDTCRRRVDNPACCRLIPKLRLALALPVRGDRQP